MTHYRDLIGAHILASFADDLLIYWDNVRGDLPQNHEPFIAIAMREIKAGTPGRYMQGEVQFSIAAARGTGTAFHDDMVRQIKQKICHRTFGYLTILGSHIGQKDYRGGYYYLSVIVRFIQFEGQTHG